MLTSRARPAALLLTSSPGTAVSLAEHVALAFAIGLGSRPSSLGQAGSSDLLSLLFGGSEGR